MLRDAHFYMKVGKQTVVAFCRNATNYTKADADEVDWGLSTNASHANWS
jgi:hypothetical protein